MNTPAQSRGLRSRRFRRAGCWLVPIVIGAWLRLWPIASALPYIDYIDEGAVLHQAMKVMQERTYDIGLYDYPSLPAYLVAGAATIYAPVYKQTHGRSFWNALPSPAEFHTPLGEAYDLLSPPELILVARAVTALLSIGTIAFTGLLARLLIGWRGAFIAMLLAAVCPSLVSRGSIVNVDPIATFFTTAALYCCARVTREPNRTRYVLLAAIATALAFTAKYPAGAVYVALLAAIVIGPAPIGRKLRLIFISGVAFTITSVIAMPAFVLQPSKIISTWSYLVRSYDEIQSNPGYFGAAVSRDELGWLLVTLAFAGMIVMLSRPGVLRKNAIAWCAFATLLLAALIGSTFQPFRNLLPLVPLVCVAAAAALVHAARSRFRLPISRSFARTIIPAVAMLVAALLATTAIGQVQHRRAIVDTRVIAIDWLRDHVKPNERILALRELDVLPSEYERVHAHVSIVSWFDALDFLEREEFDYVVAGEPDLRLATDPQAWASYREKWNARLAAMPIVTQVGQIPMFIVPYLWQTNDEQILILKTR